MKIGKKKLAIVLAILAVASVAAFAYAASVYWSHSFTHNFSVVGINAVLMPPNFDSYASQTQATDVDANGNVALAITSENFYVDNCTITWQSNATGLNLVITGTYYRVYYYYLGGGFDKHFEPDTTLTTFNITAGQSFNLTKPDIMYTTPTQVAGGAGAVGYCLVLNFYTDTELVTIPASYYYTVLIQLGFASNT